MMNASQKLGVAKPSTAKNIRVRSDLLPECHADTNPVEIPRIEEMTITWIPSERVGWSLGRINSVISFLEKDGGAQVAAEHVPEPVAALNVIRPVESQVFPDSLRDLGVCLAAADDGRRITRRYGQQRHGKSLRR